MTPPLGVEARAARNEPVPLSFKLVTTVVGVIVKVCALDVTLFTLSKTVTLAGFSVLRSVARIAAVRVVLFTKVVVRALPFHCTTFPLTKPDPLTVRVKAPLPAAAVFGLMPLVTGVGLLTCWLTVPLVGSNVLSPV